jgi:FkbM family methyltransferase
MSNKTILDIGGFIGDSALFFLQNGARKVLIYDPISENILCARHNLKKYPGKYVLNKSFVCDRNGVMEISSSVPSSSMGFGKCASGPYRIRTRCISIEKVLQKEKGIDIAKFDCEGCEYDLIDVPDSLIKGIPYWSLGFHDIKKNKARFDSIVLKFKQCGFAQARSYWQDSNLAIFDFVQQS